MFLYNSYESRFELLDLFLFVLSGLISLKFVTEVITCSNFNTFITEMQIRIILLQCAIIERTKK